MNIAIATVSSSSFINGTRVLLHSFLKHNYWFNGDILIICDEEEIESSGSLDQFPNLKFIFPDKKLLEKIEVLKASDSNYDSKYIRFLSIESFNQNDYDKILFLDSDMICLGDVEEIFHSSGDFLACPDYRNLLGFYRDPMSFKPIHHSNENFNADSHFPSFNTGLMLIGKKYLNKSTYVDLCDLITYDRYKHITTNQTDTVALNLKFKDDVNWIDSDYNSYTRYLYLQKKSIESDWISSYKFIHFLGKDKPWLYLDSTDSYPFNIEILHYWIKLLNEVI